MGRTIWAHALARVAAAGGTILAGFAAICTHSLVAHGGTAIALGGATLFTQGALCGIGSVVLSPVTTTPFAAITAACSFDASCAAGARKGGSCTDTSHTRP